MLSDGDPERPTSARQVRKYCCRSFQHGGCRFGAYCKHAHIRVCPKLFRQGWCEATNCGYPHIPPPTSQHHHQHTPRDSRKRKSFTRDPSPPSRYSEPPSSHQQQSSPRYSEPPPSSHHISHYSEPPSSHQQQSSPRYSEPPSSHQQPQYTPQQQYGDPQYVAWPARSITSPPPSALSYKPEPYSPTYYSITSPPPKFVASAPSEKEEDGVVESYPIHPS